ncbi:hypothetical protein ASE75_00950 [Sphingomonas sp. Leaf17]|uniref:MAPEG family protein n=1 Tax=Sphingomonas sp. Leaf17 TaxID=1735683 RepID=UPI0006F8EF62|nr:MAPEG family protein [Sphingomonas sp. Leaf17]KQM67547.1 hypothetical protein ASE75_00950 [Sphingomonas sp. Leaf17]
MILLNIIWPTFLLVGLAFVMFGLMVRARLGHMKATPPSASDFTDGTTARAYFASVDLPANNLANMFEMPVLYFVLVPLLLFTGQAGVAQALLAWIYVLTRILHSHAHVRRLAVPTRFRLYLVSNAVLAAMWIGFFMDMLAAAHAYRALAG